MMEAREDRFFRLESQVSVDAAPDFRDHHKGPVRQETSLLSKDVSMDALPRNDPSPLQMRTHATDSNLHPVRNVIQGESKVSSSSASSDAVSLQSYEPMVVCKSVQDKILSRLDSKNESYIEESPHFSINESISSMDDDCWLKELKACEEFMPEDIKIGYYDVMVLYSEDNQVDAKIFCEHLKTQIILKNHEPVKAVLYDCDELTSLAGSKLAHLERALERCTYVFIYMTKEFCEDKWMELSSEECLMKAIYDEEKRWCVVPVYTVSRRSAKFKIPMGLNSLKGINYYNNDQFYRNGVSRLIEDKLYQRLKNERKHKLKQYAWYQQHKRDMITEEEKKKRLEHMEKQKNLKHTMEEQRKTEEFLTRGLNQHHPMDTSDMHHSHSEPGLQNMFNNIPHSASSGCLGYVFAGNFNPNSVDMAKRYNMASFQGTVNGNANILESVDPYTGMRIRTINGNPPPYSLHMSSPPHYSDVVATQAQPSQQGQIQSLWCNQQDRTNPALYHQQALSQMYMQNPNLLPTSIQQTHNQMPYTQSVTNNQQMQNELGLTHQRILNQSGLGILQLDQTGTQNTGLRTDSNMQQTVNQAAENVSVLYSQGREQIGIPQRQRENNIEGGDHMNHLHGEPHSHVNETPSNNSTVSADQLSQLGSTNEMEPTPEKACDQQFQQNIPYLSQFGSISMSTSSVDSSTRNDSSIQDGGDLPDLSALCLNSVMLPSEDGRSLNSVESANHIEDSQTTLAHQSHGSKKMPFSQSENASCSTPTPTDLQVTDVAESGTETIRKTGGGIQKVIVHHHYHHYEKERDDPKVINIFDAKTIQIGENATVIESKEGKKKSKSSKEFLIQEEKTKAKYPAAFNKDVAHNEIEDEESQSSVTGIAVLKVAHASVVNQHDSKQSQDCMSLASRTSPQLKHSVLNNKDDEKREEEPCLRTNSKDHDEYVRAEKEHEQDASIPKVSIVRNIEKKNMPTDLGTRPKASKPVAKVPPSPSVAQNPPFKKDMGNDNEETDLKTVDRKQSDDTGLKTVHETGTGTVHGTQTESEETSLKLAVPSRAKNRASPVREIPQTDLSQYQATIQQMATNRASPVREIPQTDLSQYQATIQQMATNRASPVREGSQTNMSQYQAAFQQSATKRASPARERPQTDLSQYQATIPQKPTNRTFPVKERPQTNLGLFQANTRSTGLLFTGASLIAAASSLRNDAASAEHVQSGEDSSSQDELDCEIVPDGGPPKSEGFIPNPQGDKEEWHYVETDSFDANDASVDGFSNKRRMKKPNSSSTDNKSCTVS